MNEYIETDSITEIARPEDILPSVLHILPLEKKPFFPGQVLPIILDAARWGKVLKKVYKSGQGSVGVVFTDGVEAEATFR